MAAARRDPQGIAPDRAPVALLLIDVINHFAYPDGLALRRRAQPMARRLRALKARAHAAGVPVLYVNDTFGRWRSDFAAVVRACTAPGSRGREIAGLLAPGPDDYFVLKPRHSGFHASPLHILLEHLGAERLILTGLTTPQCVLITASDAHMRGYRLAVPRDCVAASDPEDDARSLALMRRHFSADTRPSPHIRFLRSRGQVLHSDISAPRPSWPVAGAAPVRARRK